MNVNMPIRYHYMAYRREQLWLPVGLWGLFVIIAVLFRSETKAVEMTGAFLGVMLPLMAGVLAGSALVGDPALELQLAAPRAPWRSLMERLGLLFGVIVVTALAYQVVLVALGIDISAYGTFLGRQLIWLAPGLAFIGLGSVVSLAFAQGNAGVMFVSGIWIAQVLLRDWFDAHLLARYVFLFMGYINPANPSLAANQVCLIGLAVVFFVVSAVLLRREERYI